MRKMILLFFHLRLHAAAVEGLKDGTSPRINNVTAEYLKKDGQTTLKKYTKLCNEGYGLLEYGLLPGKSLLLSLFKFCGNENTISLIMHPRKILFGVILNRLGSQSEKKNIVTESKQDSRSIAVQPRNLQSE